MRQDSRRGAYAVEFAFVLPVLALLMAGVVDTGQYLMQADGLVEAVANGARTGAIVDPDDGQDPLLVAADIAERHWISNGLPGTPEFAATLEGASPDTRLVLRGKMPFDGPFGLIPVSDALTWTHTVRLIHQEDTNASSVPQTGSTGSNGNGNGNGKKK